MTTTVPDDTRQLADTITAVCNGDQQAWQQLPVPIRATLAAIALAATDRDVTGAALARAGRYSRTTAIRDDSPWRELLTALSDNPTTLLDVLDLTGQPAPVGTRARAEIAKRDRRIAQLRDELEATKAQLQPVLDYSHDLAAELRNHRDHERAQLQTKVRPLSSVDGNRRDRHGR